VRLKPRSSKDAKIPAAASCAWEEDGAEAIEFIRGGDSGVGRFSISGLQNGLSLRQPTDEETGRFQQREERKTNA